METHHDDQTTPPRSDRPTRDHVSPGRRIRDPFADGAPAIVEAVYSEHCVARDEGSGLLYAQTWDNVEMPDDAGKLISPDDLASDAPAAIFEDVDGKPRARLPFDGQQRPRVPDGVRYFSIADAVKRFGWTADRLRREWNSIWGKVAGEVPPPSVDAASPTAAEVIEIGRQVSELVERLLTAEGSENHGVDEARDQILVAVGDAWRYAMANERAHRSAAKRRRAGAA